MARILQKVELDENATSDLLCVDTEFLTSRNRLDQVAICDSKEGKKLGEFVSDKTIFFVWAFDVAYVRDWLEEEKVSHNLPANYKVCLLYPEFRANMKKWIGDKCFKGHSFPLSLPFIFALLFQGRDLVGMNHYALVDAQQTAILHRLFLDLCKVSEKRVLFKGTSQSCYQGYNRSLQIFLDEK
ncbi:hypothetical protein N7493_001872 [Penicillium malachiteum]|uniref:Uncharacterized protein n=1 Tax=Penicillium malachiteum TaxID=1324776 RepID=A0AAD6HVL2_9EURO|nr:hypothetical protein N7493_001872 [Penicillium malachiteum]